MRPLIPAILAALAFGTACEPRSPTIETLPAELPPSYVLEVAGVIDGTGGAPIEGAAVVVQEGRIAAVGARGRVVVPDGAPVYRLRDRWLIPGLIDMHAHVTTLRTEPPGVGAPGPAARARSVSNGSVVFDRATSERVLEVLLRYGITTVRNPSAPTEAGVALREAVAQGRIKGPRIFTAGSSLVAGRWGSAAPPHVSPVPDAGRARLEVRRQIAAGVDFIKVYGSLRPYVVRSVIDEAHAGSTRVVGHLGRTGWTEAARMGIDAVAHGAPWTAECLPPPLRAAYRDSVAIHGAMRARLAWLEWLDPQGAEVGRMIRTLAGRGVTIDPTLIAYHTKFWGDDTMYTRNPLNAVVPEIAEEWARGTFVDDWSPQDFARAKVLWPKLLALVKRYDEEGILLTAGSDEPNPWVVPGESLHRELELLVDAGIPAVRVLAIATLHGARALGIERAAGSIAAGKRADLVLLRADPLRDIRNTRSIEMVIQGGRAVAGRLALEQGRGYRSPGHRTRLRNQRM